MDLLSHVFVLSTAAYLWEQSIFIHYSQYGFRITGQSFFTLKPQEDTTVAIRFSATALTFCYHFRQALIFCRRSFAFNKIIVPTSGHTEKSAHNRYRVDNAKKLLKDPANKVFEVACAVGIEDPGLLYACFYQVHRNES